MPSEQRRMATARKVRPSKQDCVHYAQALDDQTALRLYQALHERLNRQLTAHTRHDPVA